MTTDVATNKINEPETPQPFWKSKWLWITVIPPYIYFSGYSYFKGKMNGFGFPDAEITSSIGEVYLQAYEAFSVITDSLLKAAIKNFLTILDAILISSVVGAIFILLYILYRHYKPRWLEAWLVKIDQATAHTKGAKPSLKRTVAISAFTFVWILITSVGVYIVFNFIVLLIFLTLSISASIGLQHAEDMLSKPVCITLEKAKEERKGKYVMRCTKILLSDGKEFTGRVVYRDESFLYMVTNDSTLSIPVDLIILNSREIYR